MTKDDLLAQATCAVLKNDKLCGTAWLINREGYLFTAAHILSDKKNGDVVFIRFLNDSQRIAKIIDKFHNHKLGIDYAVLKLEEPISQRIPLPISLSKEVGTNFTMRGYGSNLIYQSACKGSFVGPYLVNDNTNYCLYELSSKEAGESGFSGAAIYSENLKAVVAFQTEATKNQTGPRRDSTFAFPLFRVDQKWLSLCETQPYSANYDIDESVSLINIAALESHILDSYEFYLDTTRTVANYDNDNDQFNLSPLLQKYRSILAFYLQHYFKLQKQQNYKPDLNIIAITKELFPELLTAEHFQKEDSIPYTFLYGSKTIQVGITQVFRIADILTKPGTVKAKKFFDAITEPNHMRRTINDRKKLKLGSLGCLRPVSGSSDLQNHFWKPALPNLKSPICSPICFFPYELSITEYLKKLNCEHDSIFEKELIDTVTDVDNLIENTQVSGHIRIYPPGVGIVKLNITLTFKNAINIEITSQIARHIEELLFVDPSGLKKPCESILLDLIDEVTKRLFKKEGMAFEERRWKPPSITFSFCVDSDIDIIKEEKKIAYLMSLAPNNHESLGLLRNRVRRGFNTSHWLNEKVFEVVGQGVTLLFIINSSAHAKTLKRKKTREWLIEANELVTAAVYALETFAHEIDVIYDSRLLDDSWLDESNDKIEYLKTILSTMRIVFQAVSNIKNHLRALAEGILIILAKDIWMFNNPTNLIRLHDGLSYISEWLDLNKNVIISLTYDNLSELIEDIKSISPPFHNLDSSHIHPSSNSMQEVLESKILNDLNAFGDLVGFDKISEFEKTDNYLKQIIKSNTRIKN